MKSKLKLLCLIFFVLDISLAYSAKNFNDLREHEAFFKSQSKEYVEWLSKSGFKELTHFHDTKVSSNKVVLIIGSSFNSDDSLKVYWKTIQNNYYNATHGLLADKILKQFAFLTDLDFTEAEIVIQGKQFVSNSIRIYFKDYTQVAENFPNTMSPGNIQLPIEEITLESTENLIKYQNSDTELVKKLRRTISNFIRKYYEAKGARWYTANVDTTETYYNSFTYRITCLNNEILKDGYYEFVQFYVSIQKINNTVSVYYDINGKFAAGVFCPKQREALYKPVEGTYPGKMEAYAKSMEQKLTEKLKGISP